MEFYNRTDDKAVFYMMMKGFKKAFVINGRNAATEEEIEQLRAWDLQCEIDLHSAWLNNFKDKYLSE